MLLVLLYLLRFSLPCYFERNLEVCWSVWLVILDMYVTPAMRIKLPTGHIPGWIQMQFGTHKGCNWPFQILCHIWPWPQLQGHQKVKCRNLESLVTQRTCMGLLQNWYRWKACSICKLLLSGIWWATDDRLWAIKEKRRRGSRKWYFPPKILLASYRSQFRSKLLENQTQEAD